ncbi:MAG: endospore germination permease [Acetanaerobacterium sp.]
MTIVKEKITSRGLLFACASFVQASTLLTAYFLAPLKQNAWIGVIVGYVISLAVVHMYFALYDMHRGKNLVEIGEAVFGRVGGKLFGALYGFYFFTLAILNISTINGFVTSMLMPQTPPWVLALLFLFPCILAARKGLDAITRFGPLLCVFHLIAILSFFGLLTSILNPSNLLPILHMPVKKFVQGVSTIVSLPLCDTVCFLMIIPYVEEGRHLKRSFIAGLSVGACTLLLIVFADIMTLGAAATYFSFPEYQTLRLINLAEVFSHMETTYALLHFMMRFFKMAVLLYVCALTLAQLCHLRVYAPLVAVIGVFAGLLSLFDFPSASEAAEWGINTASVYASVFTILLPAIALIVSSVRAHIAKKGAVAA